MTIERDIKLAEQEVIDKYEELKEATATLDALLKEKLEKQKQEACNDSGKS